MKLSMRLPRLSRIRAAIDGWVRSFSLRDSDLYHERHLAHESGATVTPHTVLQLDAAWGCVRLISETIATLPLAMYERTSAGKRLAADHALHFVIHDQPNVDSTAAVFWEAMVAAMLLRGGGRAEKLYVGTRLVALAFLSPDRLTINRDGRTSRRRYFYLGDNGQREIPEDRIWTIPGFTLNGVDGVSVIAYGAKVFGAAIAAETAAAQTFRNGMLKTVYYKVAAFLTKPQRQEFKENVLGSIERGETPLLEGGTDAGTIGISPHDAQLLESRGFSVEAICRWFRVDPTLVGHGNKDSNWGTGLEQKMIGFLIFTLAPWLRRIEQAISKDLLTPVERTRFYPKFAVEGLLRADSAARAAFYAVMVNNGILTRDEVRELEDREPMGGNAAKLTVQSAMTTLDSLGTSEPAAAQQARAAIRAFLGIEDPAPEPAPAIH
jgi:HK97 family phage portal protein